jgi:hypothetical protein
MLTTATLALRYVSSSDFNLSGQKAFHSNCRANHLMPLCGSTGRKVRMAIDS